MAQNHSADCEGFVPGAWEIVLVELTVTDALIRSGHPAHLELIKGDGLLDRYIKDMQRALERPFDAREKAWCETHLAAYYGETGDRIRRIYATTPDGWQVQASDREGYRRLAPLALAA